MNTPEPNCPQLPQGAAERVRAVQAVAMTLAEGHHDDALSVLLTAYANLLLVHPCCFEGGLKALSFVSAAVHAAQTLNAQNADRPPAGSAPSNVTH